MRLRLCALALALAACGNDAERGATAASAASIGLDPIVLRVPAAGGSARAYRYPALDSLLWQTRVALPARSRVLGFNAADGTVALVDDAGVPWRLTLGSGALERAHASTIRLPASPDGSTFFGLDAGNLVRLVPNDVSRWVIPAVGQPSDLQPMRDGGVLAVTTRDANTRLIRYRPPDTAFVDTVTLDGRSRLVSAAGGDRLYLTAGPRALLSVRSRDLSTVGTIALGDSLVSTAVTPSGDRVYALVRDGDGMAQVLVIDKYNDEITTRVDVPSGADQLRMDPLGRTLLVHAAGDSVALVSVADNRVVGTVASPWRADLPMVFPDGRVAVIRGDDVVLLSSGDFQPVIVVPKGANDLWSVVLWNGFRRRPGESPMRATVARTDSMRPTPPGDSAAADSARTRDSVRVAARRDTARVRDSALALTPAGRDTLRARAARTDSVRRARRSADSARVAAKAAVDSGRTARQAATDAARASERGSFVVQFAALKAEEPARQLAGTIRANGERARVITTMTNGTPLYRVILGPYRSREEADRAGQASKRDYWVYEGGTN